MRRARGVNFLLRRPGCAGGVAGSSPASNSLKGGTAHTGNPNWRLDMMRDVLTLLVLFARVIDAQTPTGSGPYDKPAARYHFDVVKNEMVPMRDGVRLATDLYRPVGAGARLPVIVIRTPYDKDHAPEAAAFFAGQGYVVAVQDVRGKWHSEGSYSVEMADAQDGYDFISWAAAQPWSIGKVGTFGCSYSGEVQLLLLKMRHPAHAAAIPQAAGGAVGSAGGYYTNFGAFSPGGAVTLSSLVGWFSFAGTKVKDATAPASLDFATLLRSLPTAQIARRGGFPPTDYEDFLRHAPGDPYWNQMHYLADSDRFDTPTLQVNSWGDVAAEQTLYAFNLMRRNAVSARSRENQFVIMSPTTHCQSERATADTHVGALDAGDARLAYWRIYLDWFDHWLKGIDNGVERRPKVQYFVTGKNEWRTAPAWPVPQVRQVPLYLSSDSSGRRLSQQPPSQATVDTYVYDPADPFPSRGGGICCTGNPNDVPGIFDQHDLEARRDVLVYSTAVLDTAITIAGPVRVVLYVSSDATDTDFAAKLVDVDPQNRAWNVANGILRMRYREGLAKPSLMSAQRTYRIEVNLNSTAYAFASGHRIRLYVTSSDFPMYDRNLNTGGDNTGDTSWVAASNTVRSGGSYPSQLVLPMLPR